MKLPDQKLLNKNHVHSALDLHANRLGGWGQYKRPLAITVTVVTILSALVVTLTVSAKQCHWYSTRKQDGATIKDYELIPAMIGGLGGSGTIVVSLFTLLTTCGIQHESVKSKLDNVRITKTRLDNSNTDVFETYLENLEQMDLRDALIPFEHLSLEQALRVRQAIGHQRFCKLVELVNEQDASRDSKLFKQLYKELGSQGLVNLLHSELLKQLYKELGPQDLANFLNEECQDIAGNGLDALEPLAKAMSQLNRDELKNLPNTLRERPEKIVKALKTPSWLARLLVIRSSAAFAWPAESTDTPITLQFPKESITVDSGLLDTYLPSLTHFTSYIDPERLQSEGEGGETTGKESAPDAVAVAALFEEISDLQGTSGLHTLLKILTGQRSIQDLDEEERAQAAQTAKYFGGDNLVYALGPPKEVSS